MKKLIYVLGLLALGVVIFNNTVQLSTTIKTNTYYAIGLMIAVIVSILYGIINLK